ncbi:TatD family hydrolase [Facklamia lactis]|uniref:TatD family hydrolase n=1 Tax=Facklamia lactis TaxID=2749967 RepID=UPI0018CE235B|nr:TatD family hydrolase [Facklamia lactis]MBG9980368.1 TatD family hydrolase [Facklamia lactis]
MSVLLDSHYHLDFILNHDLRREFLTAISEEKVQIVAQTVLPSAFYHLLKSVENDGDSDFSSCFPSLGFHPWYIQSQLQAEEELVFFEEGLDKTRFVGEIGLDFSPRRLEQADRELQLFVFTRIMDLICKKAMTIADNQRMILSIHAVRSVREVLDILNAINIADWPINSILHRFSGTSDDLTRHIRMGGYLSVHPSMLETKRGRAYVKQIPGDRILLESDYPIEQVKKEDNPSNKQLNNDLVGELIVALQTTVDKLSEIRQEDMLKVIQQNQREVYSLA